MWLIGGGKGWNERIRHFPSFRFSRLENRRNGKEAKRAERRTLVLISVQEELTSRDLKLSSSALCILPIRGNPIGHAICG